MPIISTKGAFSAQGYGLTVKKATPVYVEDVFSTYIYTGTSADRSIVNNIDLSTKGGLVWFKNRTGGSNPHALFDTTRGAGYYISSNTTSSSSFVSLELTSFNTDGFSLGASTGQFLTNNSSMTYVSWTFRKQPKFFDIVTYTGTGSARTIAHSLGSTPGMIIVKSTSEVSNWIVYHKSVGNTGALFLDTTAATTTSSAYWNNTSPTSSNFTIGTSGGLNNQNQTYVAYLFADSNSGGFGLSGSDSVVACGSYTYNGSTVSLTSLGWEPQLILAKRSDGVSDWFMVDNMRGVSGNTSISTLKNVVLNPNTSTSEAASSGTDNFGISSTGFYGAGGGAGTYIYLAIRRGPMKVPTSGTSVFSPILSTATTGTSQTASFPIDAQFSGLTAGGWSKSKLVMDRLRGVGTTPGSNTITTTALATATTSDETTLGADNYSRGWNNTGFQTPAVYNSSSVIYWNFRRAPGFFDEVCYTGTGVATTQAHNLGVVPELIIVKPRNRTGIYATGWGVYSAATGVSNALSLNETTPSQSVGTSFWNSTAPTSSVFSIGTNDTVNALNNGNLYVAYLFATCPGVSKVGSYTGTGAAQNIPCGFSGGTRFVLIKRTDSTGDWYVYDSARGISSGNDPYLLLNSTAAEVTGTNYVDTYSAGFTLTSSAPAGLNANGGNFIFLAIA